MSKIELYLCISISVFTTGLYSIYQIKKFRKDFDLKILYLIFYAFFIFGIVIKSLVFHDLNENLVSLLYDYSISEFIASSEYVIFYGISITTAYFLVFNFFFWPFAGKFKAVLKRNFSAKEKSPRARSKLPFIVLTTLFSLASLAGLLSFIGPSSLVSDFSAKRFNESFSLLIYLFFKTSIFSRIFYLFGRINYPRLSFLGFPYLAFQASVLLLSSLVISNRSYLFMFIVEVILIEYFNSNKRFNRNRIADIKSKLGDFLNTQSERKKKFILLPLTGFLVLLLLVITALRTAISQSLPPSQLIHLALLKVLSGRYLFDVMKLGEIYNFIITSPKDVTFYSFGWVAPLLIPNHKDIGVRIGAEVFGLQNLSTGVTPGMFGELSYDFGVFLGALIIPVFCCAYWFIVQKMKNFIPTSFLPVFWVIVLSKFILALNSSFGACLYSFVFDIAAIYTASLFDRVSFGPLSR